MEINKIWKQWNPSHETWMACIFNIMTFFFNLRIMTFGSTNGFGFLNLSRRKIFGGREHWLINQVYKILWLWIFKPSVSLIYNVCVLKTILFFFFFTAFFFLFGFTYAPSIRGVSDFSANFSGFLLITR